MATAAPACTDVALRLAAEGVPIKCISRVTRIPSSDLREHLMDAREAGHLAELPTWDWPPGSSRSQRVPQLARPAMLHTDELYLAAARQFNLTATQAKLLLLLLQSPTALDKNRADMTATTIDVHMCSIRRRLRPFGIAIVTLWSFGYEVSAPDRRRALALIRAAETP